MPIEPGLNEQKFKELVLYVAEKSVDDPTFGATKLNKILSISEFMVFGVTGRPLTGMQYQKLEWGPAPRRLLPLQRELEEEGAVKSHTVEYGYTQTRLLPLRSPDLAQFSGEEIAIIDTVIERLRDMNATAASEYSHHWFVGWDAVDMYATIPYETVFWKRPRVTPDLVDEAKVVAAEPW